MQHENQNDQIRDVMERARVEATAIDTFIRRVDHLRNGTSGLISDAEINPHDSASLDEGHASDDTAALGRTATMRLNGGLGTSMGMDRAKSLLPVRGELTFLDIIVRQLGHLRSSTGAALPLTFLHSFRTSADCLELLATYPDIAIDDIPIELLQNKVPKLRAGDLTPIAWPADPELEWCPPGHGDLYTVLYASGLLDTMSEHGFTQLFVANSDNLGAVPTPEMANWFAESGAPFAIETVRRTANDRKGGHFATRRSDGRVILRETAQTPPDELGKEGSLDRHRFASTNNLWFDIAAARELLAQRHGILDLPVIVNRKTVDPSDPDSPAVVQLETAMGAAIQEFEGATTVEVDRAERFVPVKTTNDLLLLRSDCYALDEAFRLHQRPATLPFVDLASPYRLIDDFDARFPAGPPSLAGATSFVVRGDWTFGAGVTVVGDVELGPEGGTVPDGTVLD